MVHLSRFAEDMIIYTYNGFVKQVGWFLRPDYSLSRAPHPVPPFAPPSHARTRAHSCSSAHTPPFVHVSTHDRGCARRARR
jgi:hypothetical protein